MPNTLNEETTLVATCKQCQMCRDSLALDIIDQSRKEICYEKGEIIFKQGTYISEAVFIKRGLVKLVLEGAKKKFSIIKIISAGEHVALPSLSDSKFYSYSAVCLSDVMVCQIHHESLSKIADSKGFTYSLLSTYDTDFDFLYERVEILSTRNNHGKLAWALKYLNSLKHNGKSALEFIDRKDLSQLAAISLESVNKILQQLKNDRIIELNNRRVQILNLSLVETLSTVG